MPEKIPRLVANVDVRKFKLDPMDGFLLTRIDGRLGMKDLARETGLPEFSVERALEKLEKMGVIERYDPSAPAASPAPEATRGPQLPQFASLTDERRYDPKELEEEVDIVPEQRKRILDVYYRLDDLDHYALLGVGKEADKKTVKRSYFELAAIFHPDRYYKKNLGSFKAKMEVLFARVTEAHDTLVDAAKRLDYDAYLAEVTTTKGMEALLERALAESRSAAAAPAPAAAHASSLPPAPVVLQGPSPEEVRARKEALAKRLLGGNSIRPEQKSKPPSEKPNPLRYSSTSDAMDALKRRYEQRVEHATSQQAKKYIDAGEDALAKNDIVAAASAFGIAAKFTPDDVALAMRYQEVKNRADAMLSDSYTKQASYEEKQGHWQEAARSWQKVAKLRLNDPKVHERAANALFRAPDSDLHAAAEHAKQAISLRPQNIESHVTLVEIYLKAGLTASARRAFEVAQQIDAKHPSLAAVSKKMGKG